MNGTSQKQKTAARENGHKYKGMINITDGYNNRRIAKSDEIPEGWYRGMTTKNYEQKHKPKTQLAKQHMSEAQKKNQNNPITTAKRNAGIAKLQGKIYVTNGIKTIRVFPD